MLPVNVKGKGHHTTCQWKQGGKSRGTDLPMLNRSARWWWMVNTMPWLLYRWEWGPVSIEKEAGWALGPIWTGVENLASTQIQDSNHPVPSGLLYWLHYPSPSQSCRENLHLLPYQSSKTLTLHKAQIKVHEFHFEPVTGGCWTGRALSCEGWVLHRSTFGRCLFSPPTRTNTHRKGTEVSCKVRHEVPKMQLAPCRRAQRKVVGS